MAVRFKADVRTYIVAATTLSQARGQSRPRVRDFTDTLGTEGVEIPPFAYAALDDDLEDLLDIAVELGAGNDISLEMMLSALASLRTDNPAVIPFVNVDESASTPDARSTPRVGIGYDSHRFEAGGPMVLGGISFESDVHCAGHSDGDAICHAVTDAVLGAAGVGDIGEMFSDTDPANAGRNSLEMLAQAVVRLRRAGYAVWNVDVTVIAEQPRIGPLRDAMRRAIAAPLDVDVERVSIKGKTNEGMGWIGRNEGLAVIAVASVVPVQT